MMVSREAVVDYMTPLGLHHLMGTGHHYGPMPWDASGARADWRPVYYHRADRNGIGFDRSSTGKQCRKPVTHRHWPRHSRICSRFPDAYLLWFHHVPWEFPLRSGRTLWQELVAHYGRGIDEVKQMRATWRSWMAASTRNATPKPHPFSRSSRTRHSGGATPASPTGRASMVCRCRWARRPRTHTLDYYKSLAFPMAPGR